MLNLCVVQTKISTFLPVNMTDITAHVISIKCDFRHSHFLVSVYVTPAEAVCFPLKCYWKATCGLKLQQNVVEMYSRNPLSPTVIFVHDQFRNNHLIHVAAMFYNRAPISYFLLLALATFFSTAHLLHAHCVIVVCRFNDCRTHDWVRQLCSGEGSPGR